MDNVILVINAEPGRLEREINDAMEEYGVENGVKLSPVSSSVAATDHHGEYGNIYMLHAVVICQPRTSRDV